MPEADPQEREAAEDQKTPGPVIEERKTETGSAIPAAAVQGEQAAGTDLRIQDHLQDPGEAKNREALREEGADSPAGEAPRTEEAAEREDKKLHKPAGKCVLIIPCPVRDRHKTGIKSA